MIANILAAIEEKHAYEKNPRADSRFVHPNQSIIAQEIMKGNPERGTTPNIAMTANTRPAIAKLSAVLIEIKDFSEPVMSTSRFLPHNQYTEFIIGNQSRKY